MKILNSILLLTMISTPIFAMAEANPPVAKVCHADARMLEGVMAIVPMTISIAPDATGSLKAAITATVPDRTNPSSRIPKTSEEAVTVAEMDVRADLTPALLETKRDELNTAEIFISLAMALQAMPEPEMKYFSNAGVELAKIRHAKVYAIGQVGPVVPSAIIEASDEKGQPLGSFIAGMFFFACK